MAKPTRCVRVSFQCQLCFHVGDVKFDLVREFTVPSVMPCQSCKATRAIPIGDGEVVSR